MVVLEAFENKDYKNSQDHSAGVAGLAAGLLC